MKKFLNVFLICFMTITGFFIHLFLFPITSLFFEMGNSGVLAPWSASSIGYIFQCGLFGGVEFFLLSSHALWNLFSNSRSDALKGAFRFFKLLILYFAILLIFLFLFGLLCMLQTDDQYVWELPILPIIVLLNIFSAGYVFSKKLGKYYKIYGVKP